MILKYFFKDFLKSIPGIFPRIFLEYSPKAVTKVVKK
jgi:hypothetical protein